MNKKHSNNNGRKPPSVPKKLPKERVFGANAVHLSEDDANQLIGGIIEKGVSDDNNFSTPSSSSPLPSVFPFPVARHRSHGPHWAPNVSHFAPVGHGGEEGDEEDDEDDDPTTYAPIANFAEPVIKKKKNELDLSRWRDFVQNNDVSCIRVKDKNHSVEEVVEKQKMNGDYKIISDEKNVLTKPLVATNGSNNSPSLQGAYEVAVGATSVISSVDVELDALNESSSAGSHDEAIRLGHDQANNTRGTVLIGGAESSNVWDGTDLERSAFDDVGSRMKYFPSPDVLGSSNKQPSATSIPNKIGHEQGHTSLESQIDAENRALLERMSQEEIGEALAEIRNRINPELLKTLKKRGLQKSEKLESSCSPGAAEIPASGVRHVTEGGKDSSVPENVESPSVVTPSKLNTDARPDEGVQSSLSKGSSLWDIWSKRVEAVRTLRFSFDGNVIEGSSLDPAYTADNAAERDYLRTEGDPGAAGYTIKEALALTRSIIPGQRALALHLLASVLSKALHNICEIRPDSSTNVSNETNPVDWEAIWAYALGPEPELVLSLRLALDDNHKPVVLASAKVIQCILACDVNENFFNRLEKMTRKDLYTGPVFRIRPDIRHGFLGGGFWKYSTKPSNILLPDEEVINDKNEGGHTIQDDNVVAGQDVAAGLVRMGILPRLCYLLETEPVEECILSILVAVARHSPICASAIWKCERLVQTIVNKFTMKDAPELQASQIKSVTLLRVLAQSSKSICIEIIQKGFFQIMTWQLYQVTPSIDEWIRYGKKKCKLASELMVEQLRLWKVCVMHGYCISYFTGFFPALCLWLNPPAFEKLIDTNVFHEFSSISMEVYLVLETLARRLPDIHPTEDNNQEFKGSCGDNLETWCWGDVGPMIDMALKWLDMKADSTLSEVYLKNGVDDNFMNHTHVSSLLWILSAVMHMLNTVLLKTSPAELLELEGSIKGWKLPDLAAKISFQIITYVIKNFFDENMDECSRGKFAMGSIVQKLCLFRHESDPEMSIAAVRCLHGLLRVIVSADRLIQLTGDNVQHQHVHGYELIRDCKILHRGIFNCSLSDWRKVLSDFGKLVTSEWKSVERIEVFGRGGPAPGVGMGWGASGGGFWSVNNALNQADARLLIDLLGTFHSSPSANFHEVVEHNFMLWSVNTALALSLMAGPGDELIIQNVLDVLLKRNVLKYLDQCISNFLHSCKGVEPFKLDYKDSDFPEFGKILASHFKNRWLSVKKRKKPETKSGNNHRSKIVKASGNSLDTIPEDMVTSVMTGDNGNSLMVEWARQRLPLPSHWLLSPIVTVGDMKSSNTPNTSAGVPLIQDPMEFHEVAKVGLFFLLGIESMASMLSDEDISPVQSIPLIWKLHALSVPLLVGMSVLEEERSRYMYGALQSLYGQHLDELWLSSTKAVAPKTETLSNSDLFRASCLRFQSEINENYSAFIETLVEQYAAVSYGDEIYGRQIAIYLHRMVDASVRLATWNALSNAHALELLPPLTNCSSLAEGYLEPIEEDEGMLEAYVKSWISGSLDRAATRNSMTYIIVLHHLSSFIFNNSCSEKLLLRNKLVKSLLRDYSRKQQHEAMMLGLVQYHHNPAMQKLEQNIPTSLQTNYTGPRLELLKDSCEGNSQLLTVVEKLKSSIAKKQSRE